MAVKAIMVFRFRLHDVFYAIVVFSHLASPAVMKLTERGGRTLMGSQSYLWWSSYNGLLGLDFTSCGGYYCLFSAINQLVASPLFGRFSLNQLGEVPKHDL